MPVIAPLVNATVTGNSYTVTHYKNHKWYVFSVVTGLGKILYSTVKLQNVSSRFALPSQEIVQYLPHKILYSFPSMLMINVLSIMEDRCAQIAGMTLPSPFRLCNVYRMIYSIHCAMQLDAFSCPLAECGLSVCAI